MACPLINNFPKPNIKRGHTNQTETNCIFSQAYRKDNQFPIKLRTLSGFTCIPKSCCSQVPTQHKLSLYSQAWRAASTERSPRACLVVPVFTIYNHSEIYSNHQMKVQGFRWGCVKTYKRSFCKVTEDGGHWMERVKLSLQIKPFHHLFRFISKWKTDNGLGFC